MWIDPPVVTNIKAECRFPNNLTRQQKSWLFRTFPFSCYRANDTVVVRTEAKASSPSIIFRNQDVRFHKFETVQHLHLTAHSLYTMSRQWWWEGPVLLPVLQQIRHTITAKAKIAVPSTLFLNRYEHEVQDLSNSKQTISILPNNKFESDQNSTRIHVRYQTSSNHTVICSVHPSGCVYVSSAHCIQHVSEALQELIEVTKPFFTTKNLIEKT